MLSPENIPPTAANNSATPKTTPPKPPQEQPQRCPRCDSSNTKFCYYNNYSLTQPRHFCKTCRRYWTRGGALRNVPIGGGCRKTNKKLKTATTPTSSKLGLCGAEFGPGFKFMNPVGHTPASMEFNLGGLHPATAGLYTQFITSTTGPTPGCGPYFGLDLSGLNYSATNSAAATTSVVVQGNNNNTTTGGNEHQISIASIESLSSINQEMHWKLQQQRLAMIYGATSLQKDQDSTVAIIAADENAQDKPQGAINLFNNLEINISNNHNNSDAPRKIDVGPNELLFDQIQTSGNYGGNNNNNSCDNVNQVGGSNLHGVWGDLLNHNNHNHNHHQQQQLQFNGLH